MICPRCGTVNAGERAACTRCAGSLAAPPPQERPLPGVIPLTRRAELMRQSTRPSGPQAPVGTGEGPAGTATGDGVYLLASERSTGQPPPPDGLQGGNGPARPDGGARNDRFVPRLSPAP